MAEDYLDCLDPPELVELFIKVEVVMHQLTLGMLLVVVVVQVAAVEMPAEAVCMLVVVV